MSERMTTAEMVAWCRRAGGCEGTVLGAIADRLEALERVAEAAADLRETPAYMRENGEVNVTDARDCLKTFFAVLDALEADRE